MGIWVFFKSRIYQNFVGVTLRYIAKMITITMQYKFENTENN